MRKGEKIRRRTERAYNGGRDKGRDGGGSEGRMERRKEGERREG